ncbi:MAG: four helix bundle protein [Rubricoccaceae bacterium]
MATARRFEDLEVWQDARQLTRDIYQMARAGDFARDFGLRDQICRAAVSVMSNIAEGFESGSDPQFARFLRIAKGSAGEIRSQLYCALDLGYIDQTTFVRLRSDAERISRRAGGLLRHLTATSVTP